MMELLLMRYRRASPLIPHLGQIAKGPTPPELLQPATETQESARLIDRLHLKEKTRSTFSLIPRPRPPQARGKSHDDPVGTQSPP
jgi:hypothetical protein